MICSSPHPSTDTPTGIPPTDTPPVFPQELVNLLLIGRAFSNVFDGERVLGGGEGGAAGLGLSVRFYTVQCNTCYTVQYNTVIYSAVQYMLPYSIVQYSAVKYSAIQ